MAKKQNLPEPAQPKTSDSTQSGAISDVAKLVAAGKLTFTRSADYKTISSNVFRPRIGNGNIAIVCCRTTHTPGIEISANIIEEQIEITMSWTELKMLEQTLRAIVDALDHEVGEIPTPTSFKINPEGQRAAARGLGFPPPAKTQGR
jgi:hypothetical protein